MTTARSDAPAPSSYTSIRMYHVPACGFVKVQVSPLPAFHDRQVKPPDDVVGGVARRTYRSRSPVPPLIVTVRFVFPAGT